MSNRPEGPPYTAEAASAAAAAQQAGLGRPRRSFATTKLVFGWRVKDAGYLVYEFEGGLVGLKAGGRPEVFPWARITEVIRIGQRAVRRGRYVCTQFVFKITRDDGAIMKLTGSYVAPEWSKQADPQAEGSLFHQLGEDVTNRVSATRAPAARAALARGESVKFGLITISADGFVDPRGLYAWDRISETRISDGNLAVRLFDKRLALFSVPLGHIPNLPLLLTLVREFREQVRSTGG